MSNIRFFKVSCYLLQDMDFKAEIDLDKDIGSLEDIKNEVFTQLKNYLIQKGCFYYHIITINDYHLPNLTFEDILTNSDSTRIFFFVQKYYNHTIKRYPTNNINGCFLKQRKNIKC